MNVTSIVVTAVAAFSVVAVAACGGRGKTSSTSTVAKTASASTVPSASKTPGQSSNSAGQNGDRGDAEFGLTEEEVARRVDAVESLIATCMTDAGFEYIPVDYATVRAAMNSNSKPSGLKPDEFRTQFGYGITTLFAGAGSQAALGAGKQNTRIQEALNAADRVAYSRTLYGDNPDGAFVTALDQEDFSQTGGCTRDAVHKVFSPEELGPGFANYQNAAGARIDQDPRVIAAYRDWAGCMRKAGYPYNDKSAIDAHLTSRLDTITAGKDPKMLSAAAQAALGELQGEERAIAAADHDCEIKFVDAIKKQVETEILGPNANP